MATDPRVTGGPTSVRKPFPELNQFRPFIVDELARRQATNFSEPSTPFMKMTSCLSVPPASTFLTLGLHGYKGDDVFDAIYGKKDVIGYTYDGKTQRKILANAQGIVSVGTHPAPGVTSVTVNRMILGKPFKVIVNWKCYNLSQLESLEPYFLTMGIFVVVEWGQKFSSANTGKYLDFGNTTEVIKDIADMVESGRGDMIDKYIAPSQGNYDWTAGKIADFSVEIDEQQGFNCTTTFLGMGEAMYGIRTTESYSDLSIGNLSRVETIEEFFTTGKTLDTFLSDSKYSAFILKIGKNDIANRNMPGRQPSGLAQEPTTSLTPASSGIASPNKLDNIVVYSSEAGIYLEWVFFIEKILAEMISLSHEKYIPVKVKFPVSPKILDIEIGHSAFLRSVDPSVMIIARSTNSPNTAPDGGRTSGPNKEPKLEPPNEFAGFMSKGIWININALSEAFLTTQTFTEGMNKLLGMMNNASGDVWNLNLIYDDHNQNYYIVDLNFNPFPEKEVKFYKFNEKSKSELLGLTFNANLTNEQRAQVFISSVGSVSTDKRFALLNNTIFRHFSNTLEDLNLKDSVNAELDQRGTISQPITPDVYNELNSVNLQISEAKQLVPDADYTLGAARSPGIPLGYVLTGPLAGFTNSPASGQFGASRDGGVRSHLGIDLLAKEGTKVLALSDGVVLSSSATGLDPIGGNFIKLVHPALGNITSNYMHLQSVPTLPVNARVLRGDVIGIVGRTGNAPSAPAPAELHLQVKTAAGQPEDPTVLINSVMAGRSPAEIKNLVLDEASKEAALSSVYRDLISATAKRDSLFLEASARNATAPDALAVNNPAMAHKPSSARPTATSSALIAADVARIDKIKALLDDKFGILIRGYIEYDASVMKKRIAREGLDDLSKPNSFTAPKMTDIEVSLVLKGISGLSPGDGFQIDKILRSYERSGVFQITGIEDAISVEAGWVIRIAALYKILIRRPETTVAFGGGGGFHAGSGGGTTF